MGVGPFAAGPMDGKPRFQLFTAGFLIRRHIPCACIDNLNAMDACFSGLRLSNAPQELVWTADIEVGSTDVEIADRWG